MVVGAQDSPQDTLDFQRQLAPIFRDYCIACHGPEKQKSGLRLDTLEGLLRGGESGESLLPSHGIESSHLLQRLRSTEDGFRMPPEDRSLDEAEISLIERWLSNHGKQATQVAADLERSFDHWAFQPIKRPEIPHQTSGLDNHAIDSFILQELGKKGLTLSPEADKQTLARRLSLIILGMPAPLEWVNDYLLDDRPEAWEKLVDRLLASPQFGETWGRHWLDIARYADSNGFETNRERKTAWPYRDYVIDAFNQDKPYADFVAEQLAGDSLGRHQATGFLVAGPNDIVKSPDISLTLAQRQNELDDMVHTTSTAFMGLTMGCARCHNHKFDPILQSEYFGMQAIFAGVQHGERSIKDALSPEQTQHLKEIELNLISLEREMAAWRRKSRQMGEESGPARRAPVSPRYNEESFAPTSARALRFTILASSNAEPCIDELEIFDSHGTNIALASEGTTLRASGSLTGYEIHQLKHLNDGQYGNHRSWIANTVGSGWLELHFNKPKSLEKVVWSRDRNAQYEDRVVTDYIIEVMDEQGAWQAIADASGREPLVSSSDPKAFVHHLPPSDQSVVLTLFRQKESLEAERRSINQGTKAWLGFFEQPEPTYRLYRGDPSAKREIVQPASPGFHAPFTLDNETPEKERRLQLAKWITDPDHPLTARVMVNRIWHHVFGSGLVATPSDFGRNGLAPTHPALLDWLAQTFIQHHGSTKSILRLILTSRTFRQSSQPDDKGLDADAGNRLLWRFRPRRLSAEAIRDSILWCAGNMQEAMGGPGFYLLDVQSENVMHYFPKENPGPDTFRRMVYMNRIRQEQDAIFGAFDCPDGNQVMPDRPESTTPIQALNLFNNPFTVVQAASLSERLKKEAGAEVEDQINLAFLLVQGRTPDAYEQTISLQLVQKDGLAAFCRALFNSNRFLFLL